VSRLDDEELRAYVRGVAAERELRRFLGPPPGPTTFFSISRAGPTVWFSDQFKRDAKLARPLPPEAETGASRGASC